MNNKTPSSGEELKVFLESLRVGDIVCLLFAGSETDDCPKVVHVTKVEKRKGKNEVIHYKDTDKDRGSFLVDNENIKEAWLMTSMATPETFEYFVEVNRLQATAKKVLAIVKDRQTKVNKT